MLSAIPTSSRISTMICLIMNTIQAWKTGSCMNGLIHIRCDSSTLPFIITFEKSTKFYIDDLDCLWSTAVSSIKIKGIKAKTCFCCFCTLVCWDRQNWKVAVSAVLLSPRHFLAEKRLQSFLRPQFSVPTASKNRAFDAFSNYGLSASIFKTLVEVQAVSLTNLAIPFQENTVLTTILVDYDA